MSLCTTTYSRLACRISWISPRCRSLPLALLCFLVLFLVLFLVFRLALFFSTPLRCALCVLSDHGDGGGKSGCWPWASEGGLSVGETSGKDMSSLGLGSKLLRGGEEETPRAQAQLEARGIASRIPLEYPSRRHTVAG